MVKKPKKPDNVPDNTAMAIGLIIALIIGLVLPSTTILILFISIISLLILNSVNAENTTMSFVVGMVAGAFLALFIITALVTELGGYSEVNFLNPIKYVGFFFR